MIREKKETAVVTYNTIALRGVVVFPNITTSFEVGRKMSVKAFRDALEREEPVFLVSQKDMSVVEPQNDDLGRVGVIAIVRHWLRLSNGNYQLMVEGLHRGERYNSFYDNDTLKSDVAVIDDTLPEQSAAEEDRKSVV